MLKKLKTLIKIKNAEIIKYKICTSTQKELLNLFNDLLDTILTDKILMSSKDDVNDNDSENDNDNDNENDNENMIKQLNDFLYEIIDKSKFKIKIIKKSRKPK